jgi:hypothetical protein
MKKLILVLAIALIASPALAVLDVNIVKVGSTIEVYYTGASSANLPRAFALDLQINGTGTFDSFVTNSYKVGESNTVSKGYGIYPARIVIDTAGTVTNNGNPLAASGDPGTSGTGFGTNHIILEFGLLYYGDTNKPATSGTLCVLNFTPGTASAITMVDEDTYRGGLVFVDGSLGNVNVTLALATPPGPPVYTNPASNGATGIARAGINLAWNAGAGATGHDVYFGTAATPPLVSSNQPGLTYATSTMGQGRLYYWQIVERNSAGTNAGPIWSFRVEECLRTTAAPSPGSYNDWVTWGRPKCWCYSRQCRGDINGTRNMQWVQALDLGAMAAAYGKTDAVLATITNGICADLNHTKNMQRVQALDLGILASYYGKADINVPICNIANVNFWTVPADL